MDSASLLREPASRLTSAQARLREEPLLPSACNDVAAAIEHYMAQAGAALKLQQEHAAVEALLQRQNLDRQRRENDAKLQASATLRERKVAEANDAVRMATAELDSAAKQFAQLEAKARADAERSQQALAAASARHAADIERVEVLRTAERLEAAAAAEQLTAAWRARLDASRADAMACRRSLAHELALLEVEAACLERTRRTLQQQAASELLERRRVDAEKDETIRTLSCEIARCRSLLVTALGPSARKGKHAWQALHAESLKGCANLPGMPSPSTTASPARSSTAHAATPWPSAAAAARPELPKSSPRGATRRATRRPQSARVLPAAAVGPRQAAAEEHSDVDAEAARNRKTWQEYQAWRDSDDGNVSTLLGLLKPEGEAPRARLDTTTRPHDGTRDADVTT